MLSQQLGSYIAALNFNDLPSEVVVAARTAVMDWLGSVVGGSTEEPARITARVVRESGGNPQATLIGFDTKTSALGAALVNGASCHILELDDLHRKSILHAAAPVISAAAAASEMAGLSGRDFITAVVAGYETGIRVAEAVTPSHYYYWHTTATCGTFGAAAAASRALGLSAAETAHALGNAGSQAAGLWEFLRDGAMTKHLHAGKAAQNGLLAALLAREGFTGASAILEGEKGFFRATAPEYAVERVTAGLGREYRLLENSYKIYPSCRHTHSGADLAIKLAREGLDPETVEAVRIKTYSGAVDLVGNAKPATSYQAKFSYAYCVCYALVHGKLDLDSFNVAEGIEPAVQQLLSRCRVEADPEIEKLYPSRWPAGLEIDLVGGQILRERTDYPRGDPENPAPPEEMREKFAGLTRRVWPEDKIRRVLEMLGRLEELTQIGGLFTGV